MGVSMLEGYALASASSSSQLTSFGLGSVGDPTDETSQAMKIHPIRFENICLTSNIFDRELQNCQIILIDEGTADST